MPGTYYVYIVANKRRGKTFVALTANLLQRAQDHKNGIADEFTKRYNIATLVYFEKFDDIEVARTRERALKEWKSKWIVDLVEKRNPEWKDLHVTLN